jgi:hypothetical protein
MRTSSCAHGAVAKAESRAGARAGVPRRVGGRVTRRERAKRDGQFRSLGGREARGSRGRARCVRGNSHGNRARWGKKRELTGGVPVAV